MEGPLTYPNKGGRSLKIKTIAGRLVGALLAAAAACGMLAVALPVSYAASDETELAAIINAFNPGNGGPPGGQLLAEADTASHTVTVSRGAAGASNRLELDIAAGVTILWKAEYSGWASGDGLIGVTGEGALEVTDGGVLINNGTGAAIISHGGQSMIEVSGGFVSSANGYAIAANDGGPVAVSGGFVFAAGADGAIQMAGGTPAISGSGIACAWNISVWPAEYAEDTADGLVAMPANSVRWKINGDQSGVMYMNGTTVGFLPLSGVTVHALAASATPEPAFEPYVVRVTTGRLNIRKGHGKDYPIVGVITDKGLYTIVEEADGPGAAKWGRLKSGAGWISLDFTRKHGAAQSGGATPKPSTGDTPPPPTKTPRPNFGNMAQPELLVPGFILNAPTNTPKVNYIDFAEPIQVPKP